jgi:hypothetical protein
MNTVRIISIFFWESIILLHSTLTCLFISLVFIVRVGVYTVLYSIRMEMETKACFL